MLLLLTIYYYLLIPLLLLLLLSYSFLLSSYLVLFSVYSLLFYPTVSPSYHCPLSTTFCLVYRLFLFLSLSLSLSPTLQKKPKESKILFLPIFFFLSFLLDSLFFVIFSYLFSPFFCCGGCFPVVVVVMVFLFCHVLMYEERKYICIWSKSPSNPFFPPSFFVRTCCFI